MTLMNLRFQFSERTTLNMWFRWRLGSGCMYLCSQVSNVCGRWRQNAHLIAISEFVPVLWWRAHTRARKQFPTFRFLRAVFLIFVQLHNTKKDNRGHEFNMQPNRFYVEKKKQFSTFIFVAAPVLIRCSHNCSESTCSLHTNGANTSTPRKYGKCRSSAKWNHRRNRTDKVYSATGYRSFVRSSLACSAHWMWLNTMNAHRTAFAIIIKLAMEK